MRNHRVLSNLISAECCDSPWPKARRPRGAKGAGLRYEKLVAKASGGIHNQWFYFVDANGSGYCCPDVILNLPHGLFVLECKLSDRTEAKTQLTELYLPIVSYVYGREARGIVVTKILKNHSSSIVTSLREAFTADPIPLLHWLGRGPL
jgi:hypothetical protein